MTDRWKSARTAAIWAAGGSVIASNCSIAVSQILLGLAVVLSALAFRDRRFPPIEFPLGIFLGLTVVSLLTTGNVVAGWPPIRKFFVYLILFALATALRHWREVWAILCGIVATACASALWSYVQYERKWQAAQDQGLDFAHEYVASRITGFMSHWMTFGGEMMIAFLIALAWLLFGARGWPRKAAAIAALLIIGVAIILGETRGVWLGVLAGALYLTYQWKRPLILAVPALAAVALVASPETVQTRAASILHPRGQLDSNEHRRITFWTGVAMVKAHPWLGLGPGQVERQFMAYVPPDIPRPLPTGWYLHLHNIYLQFAAERGVPAMLALLAMIGKVVRDMRASLNGADSDRRFVLQSAIAVIVGILVVGLFEHNLGDSEVLLLFLAMIPISYFAAGRFGNEVAY